MHRQTQCSARQQARGIQCRQWRIRIAYDQRDLGTPQYHRIAARRLHPLHDTLMEHRRLGPEHTTNQFIHDDAIDLLAVAGVRADTLQSAP